jgi:hypothetical protein
MCCLLLAVTQRCGSSGLSCAGGSGSSRACSGLGVVEASRSWGLVPCGIGRGVSARVRLWSCLRAWDTMDLCPTGRAHANDSQTVGAHEGVLATLWTQFTQNIGATREYASLWSLSSSLGSREGGSPCIKFRTPFSDKLVNQYS